MTPAEVIEQQLTAFNARDLDAFLATYTDDARVHDLHKGKPTLVGKSAIGQVYSEVFSNQGLRADILARLVVGNKVIDHERGWGLGEQPIDFVAVYEVAGDLIQTVWLHRANEMSVPALVAADPA